MRALDPLIALVLVSHLLRPCGALGAEAEAPEATGRPVMTSLPPAELERQPPSQRALVDARAELRRRYLELLFRSRTSAGAERAAEAFLEAAASEPDR